MESFAFCGGRVAVLSMNFSQLLYNNIIQHAREAISHNFEVSARIALHPCWTTL